MEITKEQIEEIILWARTWAEYVSDEEVLKMWYKKSGLNHNYGNRHYDLTNIAYKISRIKYNK